jgi:N-methylhydantoinase B
MAYRRPDTLAEALTLLAVAGTPPQLIAPRLLAGGTDVYPGRAGAAAWGHPDATPLLDLSAIAELRGLAEDGEHIRIGALVTWSALRLAPLPPGFAGLQEAAGRVGGLQVQNRATLLGNLCNASPAADGVPPLLALDAAVELASPRGRRRLRLADFILGNRRTALAPDEIAVAVLVPKPAPAALAGFEKLGARAYLVISIVMAAAVIEAPGGRIARARLAVGACSPVAQRLPALEAALLGLPLAEAAGAVRPEHFSGLAPIDDARATAAYRQAAAAVVLRRLLARLADTGTGALAA